jgi:hypothetical protein
VRNKLDKINDREYRRDNQKWTIFRNWQHKVHNQERYRKLFIYVFNNLF